MLTFQLRQENYLYIQFSHVISKSVALFDGSQASPACPSDKTSIKLKMSMEYWWSDTDSGGGKWWSDTDRGKGKWWSDTDRGEGSGGVILTGGNQSAGRETRYSATLSTRILAWSDLGSNPRLRNERL
jgi:hypothetical protein